MMFASIGILLIHQSAYSQKAPDTNTTVYVNAIFNGDFSKGKAGWSVLGPGLAGTRIHASDFSVGATAKNVLYVYIENAEGYVSVYSPHLIKVEPGREYAVRIKASGNGEFVFGAYEYDYNNGGEYKGPNVCKIKEMLTSAEKTYEYAYESDPKKEVTHVRPVMMFLPSPPGTNSIEAVLHEFFFPVLEKDLKASTAWPKQ
jgi:hypothetical protein